MRIAQVEIKKRVKKVLSEFFDTDIEDSSSSENVELWGREGRWDVILHAELVLDIEEEFSIRLPQVPLEDFLEVSSIVAIVAKGLR